MRVSVSVIAKAARLSIEAEGGTRMLLDHSRHVEPAAMRTKVDTRTSQQCLCMLRLKKLTGGGRFLGLGSGAPRKASQIDSLMGSRTPLR